MNCLVFLVLLFVSCSTLDKEKRIISHHPKSQTDSAIYKRFNPFIKQHTGKSGVVLLITGEEAFEARVKSIREAQHTIDIQYYIWKDDNSGLLLLKELITAANRGVRVRLLLDNFYESRYQKGFKMLDQNPGIEVRLIDTFAQNLNRRMHNKSITIDNQLSIVGGRNIGDEYFNVSKDSNFKDLDVLMVGPVVEEVSVQFDQFWNYKRSHPISNIEKSSIKKEDVEKSMDRLTKIKDYQLQKPDLQNESEIYWSEAHIVYDQPEKLKGKTNGNLSEQLRPGLLNLKKELILVSPYFIPGKSGMKTLKKLRADKVRVIVLTNSLLSTDVLSVYSGYRKYREDLIKMGVELYELKSRGIEKKKSSMGSSGSTGLHGKSLIGDREKIFVGSMNIDPRSINLNTEMGVIIKDTRMANDSAEKLLRSLDYLAFRVELKNKKLRWVEKTAEGEIFHYSEPGETIWKRIKTTFSSWLIPEQML